MKVLGIDYATDKDYGVVIYGEYDPVTGYTIKKMLLDGEPCDHVGCLRHITHPCENCGRVAGKISTIGFEWFAERGCFITRRL